MLQLRVFTMLVACVPLVLASEVVSAAEDYPNKPIRILTGGATGANGISARLVSQGLSGPLGQQVVVNAMGSGAFPEDLVAKSPPDGYTLLVNGSSFYISPLMQQMPYDPIKDFEPITTLSTSPNMLVTTPSLPVKSVSELISYVKASPKKVGFAIGGVGGSSHLAGELFKSMAGVDMLIVPYSSDAQQLTDLMTGRVEVTMNSAASTLPQVKSGQLKAIAVTSLQPSPLAPGLPTVAATLPGYESVQRVIMLAPAKTPAAIVARLNSETVRFLRTADAKAQFFNSGLEVTDSTPEQLTALIKSETAKWGKVIKDASLDKK